MNLPFIKDVNGIWTLVGDEWIRPSIERSGKLAWDNTFQRCIELLGQRQGCVVDVGAFIGDSTAWFQGHETIAFEPQRDAFVCLQHNLPKCHSLPLPVGNGELVSLSFGEGGNMGARRSNKGEHARTIKIDDLGLTDLAFLKIDAEGWEPNVLAGAVKTIERCKPLVMVEFNKPALKASGFGFNDILKYFKGWGWIEVYRFTEDQWDVVYIP